METTDVIFEGKEQGTRQGAVANPWLRFSTLKVLMSYHKHAAKLKGVQLSKIEKYQSSQKYTIW